MKSGQQLLLRQSKQQLQQYFFNKFCFCILIFSTVYLTYWPQNAQVLPVVFKVFHSDILEEECLGRRGNCSHICCLQQKSIKCMLLICDIHPTGLNTQKNHLTLPGLKYCLHPSNIACKSLRQSSALLYSHDSNFCRIIQRSKGLPTAALYPCKFTQRSQHTLQHSEENKITE